MRRSTQALAVPALEDDGTRSTTLFGTAEGLLDTPYNLMRRGRINRGPDGKPLQLIMGTNQDEMALFLASLDLIVPGVRLPPRRETAAMLVQHIVHYHQHWNGKPAERFLRSG